MDTAKTAVANWKTQYQITFTQTGLTSDVSGTVVTVNSASKTFGNLPYSDWFDKNSPVTYSYSDPMSSTASGKRFKLDSVTGPDSPITVTGPQTVTGNYHIQYYLSVRTNPSGLSPAPTPSSGWHDSAAVVSLSAPEASYSGGSKYSFTNWDIDGAAVAGNPITVTMNQLHTATANYQRVTVLIGGYSAAIENPSQSQAKPWTSYVLILAALTAIVALNRRKQGKRHLIKQIP